MRSWRSRIVFSASPAASRVFRVWPQDAAAPWVPAQRAVELHGPAKNPQAYPAGHSPPAGARADVPDAVEVPADAR